MRFGLTSVRAYWRDISPAWRLGAPIQVRRVAVAVLVALVGGIVILVVSLSISTKDLPNALDRADFASKLLTALGLFAALMWALFKFVIVPGSLADEIGQQTYENLKLDLDCSSVAYRDALRIATFNITLENVGTIPIRAGKAGCSLSIWQVPGDLNVGDSVTTDNGRPIVRDLNLLGRYDPKFPYVIGPGVTYRESESIVLRNESVVSAQVTFYFGTIDDDAQTEQRLFQVS